MGVTKDRLTIEGRPILLHLLDRLHFHGPTLLVASPEQPRPIGFDAFDRIALDEQAGEGPLAGIVAALNAATTGRVCILSIDMPLIAQPQIEWLIATAASSHAMGLLCRRQDEADKSRIEPFPCLLLKSATDVIRTHFAAGGRSMRSLLDIPGIIATDVPAEWPGSLWGNLNFPSDLEKFGAKLG